MFDRLSAKQQQILNYDEGCVVAKACPGSGKTYSVSARIAKLLKDNIFDNRGIAAISFTNVAGEEITGKLRDHFSLSTSLGYPHFLGTIDKFVNTYIFLPYGHLLMGCDCRPELVGPPHKSWTKGKGDKTFVNTRNGRMCVWASPHSYFDQTSFNLQDELYQLVPAQYFHFSFKNYRTAKGAVQKRIQDVIDAKHENFKLGYANQADANYLAYKILLKYPLIAQTIAKKFKYFIIDEAQDTDAIQMAIIDVLNQTGATNIMLIGDRDQSIFEWNNADPQNFDSKYNAWQKIDLDENWRSSQKICNFTQPLSTFARSYAVEPSVAKYDFKPEILGYTYGDKNSALPILSRFFAACEQNGILVSKSNVAILYRGRRMEQYLGAPVTDLPFTDMPWLPHKYHVRDIILGKILMEGGSYKKGYDLLEKAYFEAINKVADSSYHCNSKLLTSYMESDGIMAFRQKVFKFINALPKVAGEKLSAWITKANQNLHAAGIAIVLHVNGAKSNVFISDLLADDTIEKINQPYYSGTIHSVKGKTFEAVLMLIGKRAGTHSNYSTILTKGPKPEEEEELRNVYVGITRPRKILMLAVPSEDIPKWSSKLPTR